MGGSFGIAFINTFLDHRAAAHRLNLVSKLAIGDPATDSRLAQITHYMLSKGATAWEAPRRALGLLDTLTQQQAFLLSYIDAFRFVGFLSLACVPIILFAGRPGSLPKAAAAAAADAH
jgi:DHA2 family multidrug resistance protein